MRCAVDRRHAPRTHGLHAGAQAARRGPTLPVDDLVYTTWVISGITRYPTIYEIVSENGIRATCESLAARRKNESSGAGGRRRLGLGHQVVGGKERQQAPHGLDVA